MEDPGIVTSRTHSLGLEHARREQEYFARVAAHLPCTSIFRPEVLFFATLTQNRLSSLARGRAAVLGGSFLGFRGVSASAHALSQAPELLVPETVGKEGVHVGKPKRDDDSAPLLGDRGQSVPPVPNLLKSPPRSPESRESRVCAPKGDIPAKHARVLTKRPFGAVEKVPVGNGIVFRRTCSPSVGELRLCVNKKNHFAPGGKT